MDELMQPLRDEHLALHPHVAALASTADLVGTRPASELVPKVDEVLHFLTDQLIPHAEAEDAVLYPAVQQLLGSPRATATMSRDHQEVGRLTDELRALLDRLRSSDLDESVTIGLRRVLYGLYAVVSVHFAKEEEIYVPLLEARLTPTQAEELFDRMHGRTHAAHHH
jgi:iron-sulfur cluster repair protein YtfE (RIC family)